MKRKTILSTLLLSLSLAVCSSCTDELDTLGPQEEASSQAADTSGDSPDIDGPE